MLNKFKFFIMGFIFAALIASTTSSFGAANDKNEVSKMDTNTYAILKTQLNDIAKQTFIPSYLLDELDAARAKFMLHNKSQRLVNFAFITDMHDNNPGNTRNSVKLFTKCAEERIVDFVIVAGDIFTATSTTTLADALKLYDNATGELGKIDMPILYAPGNHDFNRKGDNAQVITNAMYYTLCQKQLAGAVYNTTAGYKNYYYKDFTDLHLRVFVLNSFIDNDEVCEYGATQLAWLQSNLPEVVATAAGGKNLLNVEELLSLNNYTRDGNYYRYVLPVTAGQEYTISVSAANGNGNGWDMGLSDATNVSFGEDYKILDKDEPAKNRTSVTFTASEGMKLWIMSAVGGLSNTNLDSLYTTIAPNIMIETGASATAYEPYILGTTSLKVIVACHKVPANGGEPNIAEWSGASGLQTILDTYQASGGDVIGVFAGHEHTEALSDHDGKYPFLRLARAYNEESEAGTINEVGFNIFSVNFAGKTVKKTKVGRGVDASYNFL